MWLSRTRLLIGDDAISRLAASCVAVFGVGGVGGHVVESLARSGVGEIHLFDNDTVNLSNLNRQIVALRSTLGMFKVDVAVARIRDINPDCRAVAHHMFYLPDNADEVDLSRFDYVADCIDTVSAKVELVRRCHALNVPLITCMGAAGKLDPTGFRVGDLSKTQVDPLAKALRKRLRAEGIYHTLCVWSEEIPVKPSRPAEETSGTSRPVPPSNAFVPAAEGLVAASEIIKTLIASPTP